MRLVVGKRPATRPISPRSWQGWRIVGPGRWGVPPVRWRDSGDAAGGAIVGILIYELLHYWYHRGVHRWDVLWRLVGRQMHHSAERVDAFGAYFGHPLDLAVFTSIAVLVLYAVLGLSPEAAGTAAAFLSLNAVFQHTDISTPRWLGYLIQRPESHRVHRGWGVHWFDYSDLPLWDIVFGTFRNPAPGVCNLPASTEKAEI